MSCDRLKELFQLCVSDINKRILIIDVRHPKLYEQAHLCLDFRSRNISYQMRVMNIDPDRLRVCTSKNIMQLLSEHDLKVFLKRNDATEVVLIDRNTDNMSELTKPNSKIMRLIGGLTKYDNQPEDKKITVPIHILKGGYREWHTKYPHFTTNPRFDPDLEVDDLDYTSSSAFDKASDCLITASIDNSILTPVVANNISPSSPMQVPVSPLPAAVNKIVPSAPPQHVSPIPYQPKPAISKPLPTPPVKIIPPTPKPSIVKNAPGTAVPVTPSLSVRPVLPRSHSSPNVAQADGDELVTQFDKLTVAKQCDPECIGTNINNNHITSTTIDRPRFNRALKPSFNSEQLNAIKAQLNFGRSPEASEKAVTGLQNLGNTCFMNSVIQCLAYLPMLVDYFQSEFYNHLNFNSQHGSKGHLAVEFGALIERLTAHKHRYIEPKSFREAIVKYGNEQFRGNEQQDSHEFMMMLFDKLHHDLNRHAKVKLTQNGFAPPQGNKNDNDINIPPETLGYDFWKGHLELNNSIITELFEGIFMSTLTCTYCRGKSNTFEVFNCLSLPIPSESRCHIRDCLSHFSNPERIEAAWECPRCKEKREADKKIVICKLPKILIIHLKRFSLEVYTSKKFEIGKKLQTTVDFPLKDLSVDCTDVLPKSAHGSMPFKSTYNLCAVVNHYGEIEAGHYTAFCKLENQRWYKFDDSKVSEIRDTDVCGQAAYILFYSAYH